MNGEPKITLLPDSEQQMNTEDKIEEQIVRLFDCAPETWNMDHFKTYKMLEKNLMIYRKHFVQLQFRMDVHDICDNIIIQQWYKELNGKVQNRVNNLLDDIQIVGFNLTRQENTLRMNLHVSLDKLNIKLQYLYSPNKFMYYLYFEKPDTEQRVYIAKNHPKINNNSIKIPDLELLYGDILDKKYRKIPYGVLLRIVTEIIMFYEETETVVKTPISQMTDWALINNFI